MSGMSFELSEDQELIRKSVRELAARFDDQYWMEKDQRHEFPQEFYDAVAQGGWLGMTIPEEYGGHGLGITEATLLAEEVARSGGRPVFVIGLLGREHLLDHEIGEAFVIVGALGGHGEIHDATIGRHPIAPATRAAPL